MAFVGQLVGCEISWSILDCHQLSHEKAQFSGGNAAQVVRGYGEIALDKKINKGFKKARKSGDIKHFTFLSDKFSPAGSLLILKGRDSFNSIDEVKDRDGVDGDLKVGENAQASDEASYAGESEPTDVGEWAAVWLSSKSIRSHTSFSSAKRK